MLIGGQCSIGCGVPCGGVLNLAREVEQHAAGHPVPGHDEGIAEAEHGNGDHEEVGELSSMPAPQGR